ncbi:MAG: virulence RhuM family protein [Alphaproteobacteria bacterium]|nr:virulence RhuM family protein [Alphaproteobacteria bacterium]MCB9792280.1 virulence RhuM family protein [Alphaproteobacteria bacterium]
MNEASGELLLYTDPSGATRLQVRLVDGTVWLSQALMASLFGKDVRTINEHLRNIYEEGELDPDATLRKLRIVQMEGSRQVAREIAHYSLPAILAVGYRVRSRQGTRFRQWATGILDEFVVKGFAMDDERLKNPGQLDYFDELLERIRAIRASERRFYQKITDIYAKCSVDYDPNAEITRTFYATVQNKLHFAVHGRTAAELVAKRADHRQPNMGLTTWSQGPDGAIRRSDVGVAKNYLSEEELSDLNRVVTMYLDFAEDQARRRRAMTMERWIDRLDAFLRLNERDVLSGPGRVSQALAAARAAEQYEHFQAGQRAIEANEPTSDFDQVLEQARRARGRPDGA